MTSESPEPDISNRPETRNTDTLSRCNQRMLDLRHQVDLQGRIIQSLLSEKDSLTKELDSRLYLVEAQLRREQKHIEDVLDEKEQLIQFQALQIHSLKQLLSQAPRSHRSSARRLLSKRYSVALDEYMRDHCIVSRALPVMVQAENEKRVASRARSLPELRFREAHEGCRHGVCRQKDAGAYHIPEDFNAHKLDTACQECCRILSQEVLEEITNRRWTSDCDSEHSDSLDSGISSPSIQTRHVHDYFDPNVHRDVYVGSQKGLHTSGKSRGNSSFAGGGAFEAERIVLDPVDHQKPRRSSSIGSFIQRTFSSSEKAKEGDQEARRHNSFSAAESKSQEGRTPHQKDRFISSANRTFGTNHRSVRKPRDVKFRKLFKFRRRVEPEAAAGEDYMTV